MDARIFFHLTDAIATASSVVELETTADFIGAMAMHPIERRALRRALQGRAEALRSGLDVAVPRPARAPRAD